MTEISNYIRKQREFQELLNSNKAHLINIETAKSLRKQRAIAYLLFIFTFPLPFHNCYIKRYYMAAIEFVYLVVPLLLYFSFKELYDEHEASTALGTFYIMFAWAFFWFYDLFTISPTITQSVKERKEQLYKDQGILPINDLISPKKETPPQSAKNFWSPIIKRFNSLVKR